MIARITCRGSSVVVTGSGHQLDPLDPYDAAATQPTFTPLLITAFRPEFVSAWNFFSIESTSYTILESDRRVSRSDMVVREGRLFPGTEG